MKKLFLSLTATLAGMASGTISGDDLRTGLFLFATPRDHALKVNLAPNSGNKSWTGCDRAMHEALIGHLTVAETEARVGWLRPTPPGARGYPLAKHNEHELLKELLAKNGIYDRLNSEGRFTFQGVAQALGAQNVPLQAVF